MSSNKGPNCKQAQLAESTTDESKKCQKNIYSNDDMSDFQYTTEDNPSTFNQNQTLLPKKKSK